jgi:hypothetical protein
MAPATTEVPGANIRVEVVKESVPVAEKKPLMESAWATAALLTAKAAASTARRLNMVISGGVQITFEDVLALSTSSCSTKLID